ncbi:methylenetetrahydrofolate reductase [NAD(P)H] [Desulfobacula sp.]|uniref:methylenetetrahydrofolate reductase [NAD(P)H] n=1 Tax=Desulfobacula sp. TaxID=2593537 RepID=UPI0026164BF6|nr:methylenetetrahydrofolate reductase [NAD(P)H] [Desulfobacula sp.]
MRVTDLYKTKEPVISMEFFPPRNQIAADKFSETVDVLSALHPDYFSVTFGAGGSTRDGSYQAVKELLIKKQLPTVAYIAGFGLGPDDIRPVLDAYEKLGIETIFVIRGDQPTTDGFESHPDSFSYASELISYIKSHYDFTLGCAGYPEGHIESKDIETDIKHLKEKVDAGAEYIVTQYFYDNQYFFDFVSKCKKEGIEVPIIPGIMPIYTIKMTRMLSKVCGSSIPAGLEKKLKAIDPEDKDTILKLGIDVAVDQCRGLLEKGVAGLHLYTMDRSKTTVEILRQLSQEKCLSLG